MGEEKVIFVHEHGKGASSGHVPRLSRQNGVVRDSHDNNKCMADRKSTTPTVTGVYDEGKLVKVSHTNKTHDAVFKQYIESKRERIRGEKVNKQLHNDNPELRKHLQRQRLKLLVDKVIDRYIMNSERNDIDQREHEEIEKQTENVRPRTKCKNITIHRHENNSVIRSKGLPVWTMEGKYNYTSVTGLDEMVCGIGLLKADDMSIAQRENIQRLLLETSLDPDMRQKTDIPSDVPSDIKVTLETQQVAKRKSPGKKSLMIKHDKLKVGLPKVNHGAEHDVKERYTSPVSMSPVNKKRIVVTLPNILLDIDDKETIDMSQDASKENIDEDYENVETKLRVYSRSSSVISPEKSHYTTNQTNSTKGDCELPLLNTDSQTGDQSVSVVNVETMTNSTSSTTNLDGIPTKNGGNPMPIHVNRSHGTSPVLIPVLRSSTIPSIPELRSKKKTLTVCGKTMTNVTKSTSSDIRKPSPPRAEPEMTHVVNNRLSVMILNRKRARAYSQRHVRKACKEEDVMSYTDIVPINFTDKAADTEFPQIGTRPVKERNSSATGSLKDRDSNQEVTNLEEEEPENNESKVDQTTITESSDHPADLVDIVDKGIFKAKSFTPVSKFRVKTTNMSDFAYRVYLRQQENSQHRQNRSEMFPPHFGRLFYSRPSKGVLMDMSRPHNKLNRHTPWSSAQYSTSATELMNRISALNSARI